MTRNDLKEKYNILGENKDITLFKKDRSNIMGLGYCGNVSLKNGKAVFEGKTYSDLDSLDNALTEWGKSLEYPVDTYCPMYNNSWRTESRIIWYLTEKLGFKCTHLKWDTVYMRPIGPSFNLEFSIGKNNTDDSKVSIFSKYGEYTFRSNVDNAADGIAAINTIVNTTVLDMAKDMVDVISVCPVKVSSEIEAYVPSKKNILGIERVSFKDMMINALEKQLKALKGEL